MHRLALTALLAALAMPAAAQTIAGSNSESSSSSASQSASGSQSNNANNVNIISSAPELQRHESTATSTLNERVNVTGQQHFKTNTPVFLAAAVSMSSDYCGGTTSAGASAAGISIGGSKPVFDENCQKLRGAESNWRGSYNAKQIGMHSAAVKLAYLAIWENCTRYPEIQQSCLELGLITEKNMPNSEQPTPVLP